ncbi:MAG: iron-sulfur cluster assembly scaffold protein [Candidatus Diapherotrites archaeon]|nr:iron-sulfur cluster assembly scaffold protein [Candidatus Diapherotrites archaeon]
MYSEKVLKEFRHPKNLGKIHNPDGLGKVGNPVCGDLLWIYIKVGKNKKGQEIIKDIKVKTFGCVAALATSSKLTTMAKGMTLDEALKINKEKIAKELDGLPPQKMHCSVLSMDGLRRAIEDYRNKKAGRIEPSKKQPSRSSCRHRNKKGNGKSN